MNDAKPYFTLREWRAHMGAPITIVICTGVAAILTLIAPFETEHVLTLVQRLFYWLAIVIATYSVGFIVNGVLLAQLSGRLGKVAMIALSGCVTALGVAVVVAAINWIALSYVPRGTALLVFLANTFTIALIVSIIFNLLMNRVDVAPSPRTPSLLARLSLEKRGALVALSVEDHYVRVRTDKGEEVVLMRLSDAIREVGDVAGLHVHRSHWVATAQVVAAVRKGDGAVLTMRSGDTIPVSRANISKIKEAGLLPR